MNNCFPNRVASGFVAGAAALLCLTNEAGAIDADSLAYMAKRVQLALHAYLPDEYDLYLEAAEELAGAGLYAEAYDIIRDLGDPDSTADDAAFAEDGRDSVHAAFESLLRDFSDSALTIDSALADPPAVPRGGFPDANEQSALNAVWKLRFGTSYDQYDDERDYLIDDDAQWSSDTFAYDSDQRPFSASAQASCRFETIGPLLTRIEPSVYLSDTRLRGSLTARGELLPNALAWEFKADAEKKRREDYGDSSDALEGELRIESSSRRWTKRVWFEAPLTVRGERYRHDRSLYISAVTLEASPGLGVALGDGGNELLIRWRARAGRYAELGLPENSDQFGPAAELTLWTDPLSLLASVTALRERFPSAHNPAKIDKLEGVLDVRFSPAAWIEPGVQGRITAETMHYTQDTVRSATTYEPGVDPVLSYSLNGYTVSATPFLSFNPTTAWRLQAAIHIEAYEYPAVTEIDGVQLDPPLYIWESSLKLTPEASIGCAYGKLWWSLSAGYCIENNRGETLESSRGVECTGDVSWSVRNWLRLDFSGIYTLAAFESGSRETNGYANCAATLTW